MSVEINKITPLVCDLHCDTVMEVQAGADLSRGNPAGHVDIPRLRRGQVRLQVFACYIPSILPEGRAYREACTLLDVLDKMCLDCASDLKKVETVQDAAVALDEGRIGVLYAIENGHAIESDLERLELLRRRGVRYMTLTHSAHLPWAASSGGRWIEKSGLNAFGESVVREMENLGILVDTSHVHESTFWDVVRIAKRPFIASHSCASALAPVPRNLTDDQIRAVAASGGMVGVNFFPAFLDPSYLQQLGSSIEDLFSALSRIELEFADDPVAKIAESHRLAEAMKARQGVPICDVGSVAAHIMHIVKLVGDDFVGFGSDFDGVPDLPKGVPDCSAYPQILQRLANKGLSQHSLRKIAGDNFLRVLGSLA